MKKTAGKKKRKKVIKAWIMADDWDSRYPDLYSTKECAEYVQHLQRVKVTIEEI